MARRSSGQRHQGASYWLVRVAVLAAAGVGYAYASRAADLFGNSTTATAGYIAGGVIVIVAATWLAWRWKL